MQYQSSVPLRSAKRRAISAVRHMQIEALRHRETLRHEIAPDVVVVRLVEQRAVEIEQHRIDGRPIGPGMRVAVTCGRIIRTPDGRHPRNPRRLPHAQPLFGWCAVARPRWSSARGPRRVGTLALTDHDTTAGLAEARAACAASRHPLRARRRAFGAMARTNYSHRRSAGRRVACRFQFASRCGAAAAPGRA